MIYNYKFMNGDYEVEINKTDEKDVYSVVDMFDGDCEPFYMNKEEIESAYGLEV